MNKQGKSVLGVAVATAIGGVSGVADAAVYTATLSQVLTYSNNGTAGTAGNITSSTATWTYDTVTQLLSQTGGTYNIRVTTAPTSTLYRTSITGLIIGNGAAAAADTYVCTEGNFGGNVGSSICGNYSFTDFVNDSTTSWGPGTTASRTIGGDDVAAGAQQTIASLDSFAQLSFDPTPVTGTVVLSNATCTATCTTLVGAFNNGQRWTLNNLVEVVQGPVDDAASAESGVLTEIDVLANDAGYSDPVTVTIDVAPDQGGTAVVTAGTDPAVVRINYTSAPGFAGTEVFTYRAVSGSLDDTGVVTVTVQDTVPDAFSFATETDVALSTVTVSAAATIGGISTAVPISVTNGEYSIDGGAFTAAAGTVSAGQAVNVRHTSAATGSTDTVTTLTVNGVAGTFTSTTLVPPVGADLTPDQFQFVDQENVAKDTLIVSEPVEITGIDGPAPILVSGGEYSIDGGAFTSAEGVVTNGQTVAVRHTSASTSGTAVTTLLSVGPAGAGTRVSDAFSSGTPRSGGSSSVDGLIVGVLGLLGLARRRKNRR